MTALLAFPGIEDNFFTLTLFLQNLTNALANGAVYALMALTVVMIYKTTGHLNFAQGEMAMFSHVRRLRARHRAGLDRLAGDRARRDRRRWSSGRRSSGFLIQPLESRSVLAPVILTLGLFFILNGGAATIWGTQPKTPIPAPFPGGLDDKIDVITDRVAELLHHLQGARRVDHRRRAGDPAQPAAASGPSSASPTAPSPPTPSRR